MNAIESSAASTTRQLTPKREQIIRQQQPGDWLTEPWLIREAVTAEGDVWQVTLQGKVLATLPDWAGNLALWIAETHDDVPELLGEIDRLRARITELTALLDKAQAEARTAKAGA
ncbi:hypothetical protein EST92_19745 [Streptomyces sp. TM32]|uniref:hypothetical protein n=1 Tax=Streptomyces sp. TM32 TaxID=1652669 RepID=UPI0010118231|nr:hypothetical protein [Streptomyces sp. TM32]RXS78868.1 hypothetical protein EST92_19745 [Streptomyces sp. TM32]